MDPKPYSNTDAAEQEAIAVFRNLIDHQYIKEYILGRDKSPNIDGTVEVVDDRRITRATLAVQIKKIGDNQTQYSCPSTLVAYSASSTSLPVLLICVDTANKRAFWKHITPLMPEYRPNQASSTVHFSEVSDTISPGGIYIRKWAEISEDYKDRLANAPTVTAKVANQLLLEGITTTDKIYFQKFIDTVNGLLDNDFITIKELLYPGIWKLGVGIVSSNPTSYRYQIYKIPEDEPATPLVSKVEDGSSFTKQWNPKTIMKASSSREFSRDPVEAAKNMIYTEVREVIERKELPIYGPLLSADILVAFVDRYYRCIGVQPYENSYSVGDLAYGLNVLLHQACLAYIDKMPISPGEIVYIDLDDVNSFLLDKQLTTSAQIHTPVYYMLASRNFPIRAAFSSLRYLQANGIKQIDRIFGVADRALALPKGRSWVWSRYSPENETRSVTNVLANSIDAYSFFIKGNRLRFPSSPYLDSNTAIIFEYEPVDSRTNLDSPGLREHHIDDSSHALPKLSVIIRDPLKPRIDFSKFPVIKVDGKVYNAPTSSQGEASYLFQRAPVYNQIIRMMSRDLSSHYELTVFPRDF
jgi:hypothetical protein